MFWTPFYLINHSRFFLCSSRQELSGFLNLFGRGGSKHPSPVNHSVKFFFGDVWRFFNLEFWRVHHHILARRKPKPEKHLMHPAHFMQYPTA